MGDITKNILAIVFFAIILASMGVTLFMIIKVQSDEDKVLKDEYVIPVQIVNAVISVFISYMILTDEALSMGYRIFITLLVLLAIGVEIYYTGYEDRAFETTPTYVVIALSFLLRSFLLIGYARGAFPQSVQTMIAPVEKAVNAVTDPLKNMMPAAKQAKPVQTELLLRWDQLKTKLKDRPEGVSNINEAWNRVVNPAKQSGRTDVKAVLKEAVALLKDNEGNPIPANIVDSVGGKRRS